MGHSRWAVFTVFLSLVTGPLPLIVPFRHVEPPLLYIWVVHCLFLTVSMFKALGTAWFLVAALSIFSSTLWFSPSLFSSARALLSGFPPVANAMSIFALVFLFYMVLIFVLALIGDMLAFLVRVIRGIIFRHKGDSLLSGKCSVITRQEVLQIMRRDLLMRRAGSWKLESISEIHRLRAGNVLFPRCTDQLVALETKWAIVSWKRGALPKIAATDADVHSSLLAKWPLLDKILSLDRNHLMVAGGAVLGSLSGTDSGDIDFFFVGLSPSEAGKLMERICELILVHAKDVTVTRGLYATTFVCARSSSYQFIHRLYHEPSVVLGGFDVPVCSVGWFQDCLVATPLAAWCIAQGHALVDLTRRSLSFESRLGKYCERGFRLLFPGFKLVDQKPPVIHGIHVASQEGGDPNLLEFQFFSPAGEVLSSDYAVLHSDYFARDVSAPFNRTSMLFGAKAVVAGHPERITALIGPSPTLEQVLSPKLSTDHLLAFYQRGCKLGLFRLYLGDGVLEPPLQMAVESLKHYKQMSIQKAQMWYGADAGRFAEMVLKQDVSSILKFQTDLIDRIGVQFALFEKQMCGGFKSWLSEQPERQWSGSFNPIVANVRDWYGHLHYNGFNIGLSDEEWVVFRLLGQKFGLPTSILNRIVMVCLQ